MSIAGYKCNYCSHFNQAKEVVDLHEQTCKLNPSTRHCLTCDHLEQGIYPGDSDRCVKGLESWDCKGNCPQWQEEIRL